MIGLESRGRHRLSIVATLIGAYKNYGTAYLTIAVIALVGNILPLVTRIPRKRQNVSEGYLGEVAGAAQPK